MADDRPYVLGHSAREIRRLELQSRFLLPPTRRLLREAGLGRGMSVLDIGTGAGDVAMLAGEIVGPDGSVVGIDRSDVAIDRARERARAGGVENVRFEANDLLDFDALGTFDLVIGRFVLTFQPDKPTFLRRAGTLVQSGGVIAFLEPMASGKDRYSTPVAATHEWTIDKIVKGFEVGRADIDVGGKLPALFHAAGLPEPELFCEIPVGVPSSPVPEWMAGTLESLAPALIGADELDEMDFALHARRIREEASRTHSALFGPHTVGAWARLA